MSTQQASLGAFTDATPDDPRPERDGLQALAAAVSTGFTTTQAQEPRSPDRVAQTPTCRRCGRPYSGDGLCGECPGTDDTLDDPLRTVGGGR